MKKWFLSKFKEVDGKGTFKAYYFDDENECIKKAEKEWRAYHKLHTSNKSMTTRYQNNDGSVRKKISYDIAGQSIIKIEANYE